MSESPTSLKAKAEKRRRKKSKPCEGKCHETVISCSESDQQLEVESNANGVQNQSQSSTRQSKIPEYHDVEPLIQRTKYYKEHK